MAGAYPRFASVCARTLKKNNAFQCRFDRHNKLFSFQLKRRPDLQLYLQNQGDGYYVMLLNKHGSTSFPSPEEMPYNDINTIDDFLSKLTQFIDSRKCTELMSKNVSMEEEPREEEPMEEGPWQNTGRTQKNPIKYSQPSDHGLARWGE